MHLDSCRFIHLSLSTLCGSATDGKDVYLTKGDNNNVDDRYDSRRGGNDSYIRLRMRSSCLMCSCVCSGLYAHGQSWLEREDIVGIARA